MKYLPSSLGSGNDFNWVLKNAFWGFFTNRNLYNKPATFSQVYFGIKFV